VPHVAIEDGYINGYFIPKGTLILANLWHMLHDATVYPDPFTFDPARHLETETQEYTSTVTPEHPAPQTDPRGMCFGYGRRICPGMHLAEASLFSCVSRSLAVFNVEKALGEDGKPITPKLENTSGIIRWVFNSRIKDLKYLA
jgi:cytochrome P450